MFNSSGAEFNLDWQPLHAVGNAVVLMTGQVATNAGTALQRDIQEYNLGNVARTIAMLMGC